MASSSRALALLFLFAFSSPSSAEDLYDVYFNNCHSYANGSEKFIDECGNNAWGVFSCFGDRAVNAPLQYHTATWVYLRGEGKMCVIEPQSPSKRHCWKVTAREATTELPDVLDNPEARQAGQLICGDQWKDPRGFLAAKSKCSKPLSPGVAAAQEGPLSCAKQVLGLPANQS